MSLNRKYASYIKNINQKHNIPNQLLELNNIINSDDSIKEFFNSKINIKHKLNILDSIFENSDFKFNDVFKKIIKEVFIFHIDHINNIYDNLSDLLNKDNNISNITIISAFEMTQDQMDKLINNIGSKNKFTFHVDSSLISGVIIKIDSSIYDYSLINDLNKIIN